MVQVNGLVIIISTTTTTIIIIMTTTITTTTICTHSVQRMAWKKKHEIWYGCYITGHNTKLILHKLPTLCVTPP
jgi:CRISPR/Cas system type I-B associated protein Csh2 (Cas7 group RAMP superfamily)